MLPYLTLFFTVFATVCGQLLTKKGMLFAGSLPTKSREIIIFIIKNMITNVYIIFGLLLAVLSTISWMLTLSKLKLSFAYPFMSLSFPLILFFSSILLGETVSPLRWLGICVVMIGLIIVAIG
jgi:drug/metabolite transporter (DMT)-like permease